MLVFQPEHQKQEEGIDKYRPVWYNGFYKACPAKSIGIKHLAMSLSSILVKLGKLFFINMDNIPNVANLDSTEYKLTIDSSGTIIIGFLLGRNTHGKWIELIISPKFLAKLKKLEELK